MAKITVEGNKYTVVDKGSYNHDIGHFWKRAGDFGLLKIELNL